MEALYVQAMNEYGSIRPIFFANKGIKLQTVTGIFTIDDLCIENDIGFNCSFIEVFFDKERKEELIEMWKNEIAQKQQRRINV